MKLYYHLNALFHINWLNAYCTLLQMLGEELPIKTIIFQCIELPC